MDHKDNQTPYYKYLKQCFARVLKSRKRNLRLERAFTCSIFIVIPPLRVNSTYLEQGLTDTKFELFVKVVIRCNTIAVKLAKRCEPYVRSLCKQLPPPAPHLEFKGVAFKDDSLVPLLGFISLLNVKEGGGRLEELPSDEEHVQPQVGRLVVDDSEGYSDPNMVPSDPDKEILFRDVVQSS